MNPFAKRESHTPRTLTAYKLLTIASWLLLVATSITSTFSAPPGRHTAHHPTHRDARTIWAQNSANPTPFALNAVLTSIFWIALFALQLGYIQRLFSADAPSVAAAANVGSHFILHNLLTSAFVSLWTRGDFWWAELLLALDFFNMAALYFTHAAAPAFVHAPAVAGPFAWLFIALLWDGAAMVNAHGFVARMVANVTVWGLLVVGMFFLAVFRDVAMGFALSYLAACLAVGQMGTRFVALQWIFAWVIAGVLFVCSLVVAVPAVLGTKLEELVDCAEEEDRERQPLLGSQ